jgi:DNA-binding XRE family transcriptional regulator
VEQTNGRRGRDHESGVGRNLRHLIGMHDLRRSDVAHEIGISPTGLTNILTGRSEPGMRTAIGMAAAFGVTIEDLYADLARCLRAGVVAFESAPIRKLARRSSNQPDEILKPPA